MITLIEICNGPDQRRNGIGNVRDRKLRRQMVAEAKNNIADHLAGLSKDDLREIAVRANFLLGNVDHTTDGESATSAAKPKREVDKATQDALQTLYGPFGEAIASAEGGNPIPLPILLRGRYGGLFRKAATRLDRLTRQDFKADHLIERLKIARLVVGLAAREIEAKGKAVSIRLLLVILSNPAGVVDSAFPGYRASGLLGMITRRKNVK